MKRLVSISLTAFICFSLFIATSSQAVAYVDPGSGLLALQSAASVAAACGYFLRRRIRGLFDRPAEEAIEQKKSALPVSLQDKATDQAA